MLVPIKILDELFDHLILRVFVHLGECKEFAEG